MKIKNLERVLIKIYNEKVTFFLSIFGAIGLMLR